MHSYAQPATGNTPRGRIKKSHRISFNRLLAVFYAWPLFKVLSPVAGIAEGRSRYFLRKSDDE
jgi:hypothetical protein